MKSMGENTDTIFQTKNAYEKTENLKTKKPPPY